jgi:hypothetical protein
VGSTGLKRDWRVECAVSSWYVAEVSAFPLSHQFKHVVLSDTPCSKATDGCLNKGCGFAWMHVKPLAPNHFGGEVLLKRALYSKRDRPTGNPPKTLDMQMFEMRHL